LDDISFRKAELIINWRKCHNPLKLPLPEVTIKAIAAYIIGARPQSSLRTLFLSLMPPYGPITPTTVNHHFKVHMQKINPTATAYWLRHYAEFRTMPSNSTITPPDGTFRLANSA
jgi:hypothetical protein